VINPATESVVQTIDVGGTPDQIVSTAHGEVFVESNGTGSTPPFVVVINTSRMDVVATISAGSTPTGELFMTVTPNGQDVYVVDTYTDVVYEISSATNQLVATITLPAPASTPSSANTKATQIAASPDGQYIYSIGSSASEPEGSGENIVYVISVASDQLVATITLASPNSEGHITFTPNSKYAYVSDVYGNLYAISTSSQTVVATISIGAYPYWTAATSDNNYIYATNYNTDVIDIIAVSDNQVVASIPVGSQPISISILSYAPYAYVPNEVSGTVSVINTATQQLTTNIQIGGEPLYVVSH
jgi:YVTN family beta-propeller protein